MSDKQQKTISLMPFQSRVLLKLYEKPYQIQDLNRDAKVQHCCSSVKHFRDSGIEIVSDYIPNPNNLNSNRKIVVYSIHPDSRPLALASLNAYKKTR